ncbi:hypothetical protein [Methanobrevibacter sp.]
MKNRLPEVIVFAGPNGSGKTTITRMAKKALGQNWNNHFCLLQR